MKPFTSKTAHLGNLSWRKVIGCFNFQPIKTRLNFVLKSRDMLQIINQSYWSLNLRCGQFGLTESWWRRQNIWESNQLFSGCSELHFWLQRPVHQTPTVQSEIPAKTRMPGEDVHRAPSRCYYRAAHCGEIATKRSEARAATPQATTGHDRFRAHTFSPCYSKYVRSRINKHASGAFSAPETRK